MPRAVSLYMPHWSVDLLLRRNRSVLQSSDRLEPRSKEYVDVGCHASSVPPRSVQDHNWPQVACFALSGRSMAPARTVSVSRNVVPVLLYTTIAGRQIVVRRCEQAAACGVRQGMTISHAKALLPNDQVLIKPHQPQRELVALQAFARWALRFSPIVAVDPPNGLLIDITAPAGFAIAAS